MLFVNCKRQSYRYTSMTTRMTRNVANNVVYLNWNVTVVPKRINIQHFPFFRKS